MAVSISASLYARRAGTRRHHRWTMTAPGPALTSLSHGAGCGCKLSAADLRPIVAGLAGPPPPRVLVGGDTPRDPRGGQVNHGLGVVPTAGLFTPIRADPHPLRGI